MKLLFFVAASFLFTHLPAAEQEAEINSAEMITSPEFGHDHHKPQQKGLGHFYNSSIFASPTNILPGTTLTFNGTPVNSKGIQQIAPDTISLTHSGHYFVNVIAEALFPTEGGIILEVDGVVVGPGTPFLWGDTPLVLQQIVPIKIVPPAKNAQLKVLVTGISDLGLNFPVGLATTINIVQLSYKKND